MPFILAAEKLMGIEAPARAQHIRTILFELSRIANVSLFLGDLGVQLGAITNSNINESADASSGAMVDNSNALTTLTLDFTPTVIVGANAVLAAPQ
ncbi:MAG: hypothetical protein ACKOFD_05590, partial [Actinomycetota bacterium]